MEIWSVYFRDCTDNSVFVSCFETEAEAKKVADWYGEGYFVLFDGLED